MSRPRAFWAERLVPESLRAPVDPVQPEPIGSRTRNDWVVDIIGFLFAVGFGVLIVISMLNDNANPLSTPVLVIDVTCGVLACLSLWWRRRWPVGVALSCVLLGAFSASATIAGLLALFSVAVHRNARPVLLVAALWVPSSAVYAIYRPQSEALWVVVLVAVVCSLAATAWGMFIRARRQLVLTLRERALRAEADRESRDASAGDQRTDLKPQRREDHHPGDDENHQPPGRLDHIRQRLCLLPQFARRLVGGRQDALNDSLDERP